LTPQPEEPAAATDAAGSVEPSEAEIEAWAARERERRQQWLSGPTAEQAAVAVIRERERREPERVRAYDTWESDFDAARLLQRLLRTTQLVAEGTVSLLLHLSVRDVRKRLVQAGLDWEEELFEDPMR
jgi:hypothetical protein